MALVGRTAGARPARQHRHPDQAWMPTRWRRRIHQRSSSRSARALPARTRSGGRRDPRPAASLAHHPGTRARPQRCGASEPHQRQVPGRRHAPAEDQDPSSPTDLRVGRESPDRLMHGHRPATRVVCQEFVNKTARDVRGQARTRTDSQSVFLTRRSVRERLERSGAVIVPRS